MHEIRMSELAGIYMHMCGLIHKTPSLKNECFILIFLKQSVEIINISFSFSFHGNILSMPAPGILPLYLGADAAYWRREKESLKMKWIQESAHY